jgi:uncharacterized protein YbjT (DUF2867 family)
MKTLVIGGTGTVGSATVKGLLAAGVDVRVMSRTPEKAKALGNVEAVTGDLTDPASARAAFAGVDSLFMLNPVSQTEACEGLSGVCLAREAGIKRIVYMSVHRLDGAPHLPHFGSKIGIEAAIRKSGMTYTLLQPNNFYQNDYWFQQALTGYGVYPQPLGEKGLHRVDARDIADAAVNALTKTGFDNQAFALVGPKAVNGAACAEIWSSALGKKIAYGGNDLEAWEKQFLAYMPSWMVFDFKHMYAYFQAEGLLATAAELEGCERIVGHPMRTFEAFANETAPTWK